MRSLPKYAPSDLEMIRGEAERRSQRRHLVLKVEIPFKTLERLNKEFDVASKFEMDRSLTKVFERIGKEFDTLAKLVEKWG
jgi:hypothetical protein